MVTFIIILILIGLAAGAVARLVVPGRDSIGILGTILLGIAGSFVGGFLWNLIEFHRLAPKHYHTVGFIGSIIGAGAATGCAAACPAASGPVAACSSEPEAPAPVRPAA